MGDCIPSGWIRPRAGQITQLGTSVRSQGKGRLEESGLPYRLGGAWQKGLQGLSWAHFPAKAWSGLWPA